MKVYDMKKRTIGAAILLVILIGSIMIGAKAFGLVMLGCAILGYSELINILQDCKRLGFILCLFTAEASVKKLQWKVQYCEHFGIKPDYVNESPLLGGITTKPFFNLLLDDSAGLESAFDLLKTLIKSIDDTKFSKERIE